MYCSLGGCLDIIYNVHHKQKYEGKTASSTQIYVPNRIPTSRLFSRIELENIRMLMNFQSPYPLFVQNLSNIIHFTCKPTAENEFKTDMLIEIILHTTSKKCPWV